MKKALIFTAVAIAVLVAGYFSLSSIKGSQAGLAAVGDAAASAELGTITTLEQNVFLKDAGAASQTQVTSVAAAALGSTVITSPTGRAILEVDSDKAVLDYNTQTVIASHSQKNQTSIGLSSGELWARIAKVFGKGEFYEIKTKNAVAVVRGTSFGVAYQPNADETTLDVTEGAVSFFERDEITGETLFNTEIKVTAGNKATRTGSGPIIETPLNDTDKANQWYIYNNPAVASTTATTTPADPTPAAKPVTAAVPVPAPVPDPTPAPAPVSVPVPVPAPVPAPVPPTIISTTRAPHSTPSPVPPALPAPPALPQITIDSIDPSSMLQGSREVFVTLTGSNFDQVNSVYLGDNAIADFTKVSTTTITFFAPSDLATGTYDVRLTDNADNTAAKSDYFAVTIPQITIDSISPTSTAQNSSETITLNGSNFDQVQSFYLGTTSIEFTPVDSNSFTFTLPYGFATGTYDVSVSNNTSTTTQPLFFTVISEQEFCQTHPC